LAKKGVGYILVDSKGRSLRNLSNHPVDKNLTKEVVDIVSKYEEVDYETYKSIKAKYPHNISEFVSLMLNNNLTFMPRPFRIQKMPADISYDILLGP
jgi:hypothetical protein